MRNRRWLVSVLAVIALLATASSARAADSPCADDIRKLCGDVPAGGGRVQACLKEHASEISAACHKKIDELVREVQTVASVCRFDIGRLCAEVSPGAGRVASCLKDREADLSPECKAGLESLKK